LIYLQKRYRFLPTHCACQSQYGSIIDKN